MHGMLRQPRCFQRPQYYCCRFYLELMSLEINSFSDGFVEDGTMTSLSDDVTSSSNEMETACSSPNLEVTQPPPLPAQQLPEAAAAANDGQHNDHEEDIASLQVVVSSIGDSETAATDNTKQVKDKIYLVYRTSFLVWKKSAINTTILWSSDYFLPNGVSRGKKSTC